MESGPFFIIRIRQVGRVGLVRHLRITAFPHQLSASSGQADSRIHRFTCVVCAMLFALSRRFQLWQTRSESASYFTASQHYSTTALQHFPPPHPPPIQPIIFSWRFLDWSAASLAKWLSLILESSKLSTLTHEVVWET